MDSRDSEITILEEVGDRKRTGPPNTPRINGELVKEEQADSHLSCHGDDEIPDFDEADLEVLDCWEDADEACDNSTLEQENIVDKSTSPLKDVNSNSESNHKSRNARSASLDSVKTIIFEDLTNLDEAKSAQKGQPSEGGRVNPDDSRTSVKGDSALKSKQDGEKSCKTDDSKKLVSTRVSMDTKKLGHDGGAHQNSKKAPDKSGESPSKKPVKETPTRAKLNLPTDPTESKVDKFLKEMALQNSHIIGLQDVSVDSNTLDSVSSESSKHSSHSPSPYTELADLPPGVDKEQSILDTTTSSLSAVASKAAESKQSIGSSSEATRQQKNIRIQNEDYEGGRGQKPHVSVRYRASDSSKGLGEKDRKSRSPSGKHLYKVSSSSRSPIISKNKKTSPARSFSISPSPSPRSRRLSRSPLPTLRVTQLIENFPSHKYVDRPHYQSPVETSRYHRSPPRDQANLRALSRSLSRERAQSRSRSKSRGRSYLRHRSRSRSRNRFSSKEERSRRYRRSSSRSRSPNRRMRSRSRSWSPQRYGRKRPSLTREDSRAKRARLSRSPSRSNSPWNIHVEVPLNEWHNTYEPNRNSSINDDVQLEHDMARFIATNIAATGLRPPVTDTRGWYDPVLKPRDTIPQSFPMEEPSAEAIRQGMGMPLPPPPPDISELMTAEEIKETGALGNMSPEVPAPSLSSLLESAVTGCPNNIILERCQDAIMKLHDVSFKPGRFVVIPSIKVPERKALSTFQLWQSVVNRLLPSKVHFNYCETTEPMVLWESSKPKPQRKPIESRSASSHTEVVPTPPSLSTLIPSSTADLDRAALLDKIFFLTRELQEVRDILDRKSVPKKHAGVQTTSVNLCENCCNSQRSTLPSRTIPVTSPSNSPLVTNRVRQRSSASSSSCQTQPVFAVHQSTYSLPVPTSKPVPKGVLKPQQVPTSQPMPIPQSVPTPQPVPAPQPVPTPQPVPAPAHLSTPVGSTQSTSISLPVPQPVPPPNQFHYSLSSTGVNTASNSLSTSSAPYGSSQSNNQLQSSSEEKTKASFGETSKPNISKSKKNPLIPPLIPGLVGSSKSNVPAAPVQATKPTPASGQVKSVVPATMSPMTSSDYDLRKYVVIGDEHGMDLRNYFLGTGMDFLFHPKLCTNGQSLDSVLKNVISCNNLCKQVVVFMGLYNSSYNSKSLDKFKQLIGYLRKRCKHLVVVEPPTIPKFQSMKSAWQLYSQLLETFQPFKSDNVSVVRCRQFLLLDNQTPNISMFSSPERLSHEGLRLIFEELKRTLEVKKTNSLWSGLNAR